MITFMIKSQSMRRLLRRRLLVDFLLDGKVNFTSLEAPCGGRFFGMGRFPLPSLIVKKLCSRAKIF